MTHPGAIVSDLTELLAAYWGMEAARVRPLIGGMNSETWLVEHQQSTYVAKKVSDAARADLVAGEDVATTLARAGILTGPPVPTRDGQMVLPRSWPRSARAEVRVPPLRPGPFRGG